MRFLMTLMIILFAVAGCQVSSSEATEPNSQKIETGPTQAPFPDGSTSSGSADNHSDINQVATDAQVTTSPPISMSVSPQFGALHLESTPHVNVLLTLKAMKAENSDRPPLDLAIVIDTSGSMRGDKIRDSKIAANELVDALTERDRVTLIQYASHVRRVTFRRVADDAGKVQLKNQINGLTSGGSTALGPALFDAFSALSLTADDGTRLRHVILMSDGLANVGEKNPTILARRAANAFRSGISVTTLGVGLDYNEDLMTRVADEGGGRYHFIKESRQIAGILGDELNSLVGTIARNVVVKFKGVDGVTLAKTFGYPTDRQGDTSTIRVGFMGSEQSREIMMRLALEPGRSAQMSDGEMNFGTLAVDFVDVVADGEIKRISADISTEIAASADAMRTTENTEVAVRLGELEAAEKLQIAAASAGNGDFTSARSSIDSALQQLRRQNIATPSPMLRQQIVEFEGAREDIEEASRSSSARKSYSKKYKARAYKRQKK